MSELDRLRKLAGLEEGMPSGVIKSKMKFAAMSDKELFKALQAREKSVGNRDKSSLIDIAKKAERMYAIKDGRFTRVVKKFEALELDAIPLEEGINVKVGNDLVTLDMKSDIDKTKFKKMATKMIALLHKEYELKDENGEALAFKVTISIK